jgi:hypothetical protein
MSDTQLLQHLANLANAIRDVPTGDKYRSIVRRFFALVQDSESANRIDRTGIWHLESRR